MKYKGLSNWKKIDNVIRADYVGGSHKVCEVNTNMAYPATSQHNEAHLKLILAAPDMIKALMLISNELDSDHIDKRSKAYKLFKIADNAISKALR